MEIIQESIATQNGKIQLYEQKFTQKAANDEARRLTFAEKLA